MMVKPSDIADSSYIVGFNKTRMHKLCQIIIIITIITLFKVDKNTNVIQVASNKIAAISIEKR